MYKINYFQERMQQWPSVCSRLLNGQDKEIRLWNDLIRVELRTRAKVDKDESFFQLNKWMNSVCSKFFMFVLINSIKQQLTKSNNPFKHFKIQRLKMTSRLITIEFDFEIE